MAPLYRLYKNIPHLLRRAPTMLRSVSYRVVETPEELKAATHLVYREYLTRGYVKPNPAELKLSIFHALPETPTFIARHPQLGIIGTIATIQDSPLGLPMDEAYKPELDTLRRQGCRLAEVSML